MKQVVFALLISIFVPGLLQAQEISPTYFNRITLDGVDELARALSDPEISVEQKRLAVNRYHGVVDVGAQIPSENAMESVWEERCFNILFYCSIAKVSSD